MPLWAVINTPAFHTRIGRYYNMSSQYPCEAQMKSNGSGITTSNTHNKALPMIV